MRIRKRLLLRQKWSVSRASRTVQLLRALQLQLLLSLQKLMFICVQLHYKTKIRVSPLRPKGKLKLIFLCLKGRNFSKAGHFTVFYVAYFWSYFLTNGHRMTRDNFVLVSLVFAVVWQTTLERRTERRRRPL